MRERTARVRNRLTASVAVTALTVLGASAFGLADATRELLDARRTASLARGDDPALTLAHALADERDAMTPHAAGGRPTGGGASEDQRARVDRQIAAYRHQAPPAVGHLLDAFPETRREALTGTGDALSVFTAYTRTVHALHQAADTVAERRPGDGASAALPPLGRAVEEASATRALLLGALAAHGEAPALTAAAQESAVRERAALADFARLASPKSRDAYVRTVSGPDVDTAEGHLAHLTRPQVTAKDLADQSAKPVRSALTARLVLMRGVETTLDATEMRRMQELRDSELTALGLRGGAAALCFLLALGVGIRSARSITLPLSALRLGARRVCADPAAEEPIAFKGRDDEFAETVRSVNVLHETAVRQQERITALESERTRLIAARQLVAEERDVLLARHREAAEEAARPAERPESDPAHGMFVGLSLRTLGLVERQLAVIEGMEAHEADPERLDTLFKLDHLATRMRRNSENLLVLAGAESGTGRAGPAPLLDVLRASVGEIERYQRVRIQSLPQHARLAGCASEDVSHLVAELLENATAFSPPDAQVQVSGWYLESGEIVLCVQDEGIGMAPERLAELNALLADPDPQGPPPSVAERAGRAELAHRPGHAGHPEQHGDAPLGLGLYVVARLAARHGVRVQLREQTTGGVAAVAVLPVTVLAAGPPAVTGLGDTPPAPGPLTGLPGSVAEPGPHALPGRPRRPAGLHASPPSLAAPVHPADPPAGAVESAIRVTGLPAARGASTGRHARPPAPGPAPRAADVTGNGLPRRTPRAVPQRTEPPRVRKGVDAEALRRKLAGFQQGAADGRRDAAAELAGRTTDRNQAGTPAEGGSVEEARG
ncbi:nitrate- and nitrite sensing domain-containing protein [Streptomyces sp. NPDC046215]|uniref:sensor histidine kinase n=1 Tax=Streptomyces sp. NPDC046215 TaxID=3155774 RepID=UPI0033EFE547